MYRSLNVPIGRLEQEQQFSLGRSTEIGRDELKFQKFIDRLRRRFAHLFYDILRKQLILKGIVTQEDWDTMKNDVVIDYVRDNHFTELKNSELFRERIQTLDQMSQYVGQYFSKEWVQKNVLQLSDEDVEQMNKQMSGENEEDPDNDIAQQGE
jgi:hypothetical protein